MKAIVTRYTISNMLEETGDDYSHIYIFLKIDDQHELKMPVIISYEDLLSFIDNLDIDAGKYLYKIRNEINGYGPKHSKIFKVIEEEGFDLEPYIHKFIESKDEQFIQQHKEWCDRLNSLPNQQTANIQFEQLKSIINDDFREYNVNFNDYKDALDQAIHETTLKYFPQLFDKSKKHVAAYKSKLIDVTLSFSRDIDKIMHDKFDTYWEERYNREHKD